MRINKLEDPLISGIPFKGDGGDVFKKPDFNDKTYIQSQKPPYNDINTWKAFCQPLRDTFEKVNTEPVVEKIQVEEVEECKNDRCE